MGALAAFRLVPVPSSLEPAARTIELIRRTVQTRGLSGEAREEQTAGYYQELLDRSAHVVVRTPSVLNVVLGGARPNDAPPTLEELEANSAPIHETLNSFLIYRPRPHLDLVDPRFKVRYVTNAFGFGDREYPLTREANTRRLVILGDSMARALGVEPGQGFEGLLEEKLNRESVSGTRYELINMGVSGYRITQIVDLAREVAPQFKPDVYVVVVSWLSVARKWGLHLAQLVEEGIDLKYPYLAQVARDARLQPGDTTAVTEAKLAPFMAPTFRWAVQQIRDRARQDGAATVAVLMPHLKGIGSYEGVFAPVRMILEEEGIPSIDLLDTFDGLDIVPYDVGDGLHPNRVGHRLLFERLQRRLADDPSVAAILLGTDGRPVAQALR